MCSEPSVPVNNSASMQTSVNNCDDHTTAMSTADNCGVSNAATVLVKQPPSILVSDPACSMQTDGDPVVEEPPGMGPWNIVVSKSRRRSSGSSKLD